MSKRQVHLGVEVSGDGVLMVPVDEVVTWLRASADYQREQGAEVLGRYTDRLADRLRDVWIDYSAKTEL